MENSQLFIHLKNSIEEVLQKHSSSEERSSIKISSFTDIEQLIQKYDLPVKDVLSHSAILASQDASIVEVNPRNNRNTISFQTSSRSPSELNYTEHSTVDWHIEPEVIRECVMLANDAFELIHDLSLLYNIELFEILGMRNLSSFVGEVFAKQVYLKYSNYLIQNPNQDGYPDLCALTPEGKIFIDNNRQSDNTISNHKKLWSPYPFGGIEVKATCGNTPPASQIPKPLIGESRLPILVSAEWKAHHQETKILLGIYWDFVDGLPTVLAVFFRNDLDNRTSPDNRDWGAIIKPTEGGGRTTSVSIMKKGKPNGMA